MAPSITLPAAPNWFADPTGRHRYRWWNGWTWTTYVWDEERGTASDGLMGRGRRGVIAAGSVVAVLAVTLAGLLSMGDYDGVGRSGLRRTERGLTVLSAVCPGERLLALELDAVDATGRRTAIWRLSGSAPLPEEMTIGDVPLGMRATSPLSAADPSSTLQLQLDTSELTHFNGLTVVAEALHDGRIAAAYDGYDDLQGFRNAAFHDLPCADPYGDRQEARLVLTMALVGAAGAAVSGLAFLTRRRLPSPAGP